MPAILNHALLLKSSFIHTPPAEASFQFFIPSLLSFFLVFLLSFLPLASSFHATFLSPPSLSYALRIPARSDARYFIDLCISSEHILICPQTYSSKIELSNIRESVPLGGIQSTSLFYWVCSFLPLFSLSSPSFLFYLFVLSRYKCIRCIFLWEKSNIP